MSDPHSSERPGRADVPDAAARLLAGAARIVPRSRRQGWWREWHAELVWAARRRARSGQRRSRLWLRAAWAWLDALTVRKEEMTMTRVAADVRLALRGLRRSPGFTAVAVLTLALGIGANTAIFSVVDSVLLEPLPYPESERVVSVNFTAPGLGYDIVPLSDGTFVHLRETARSFEELGMYNEDSVNLVGQGAPEEVAGANVTPSLFRALRATPHRGRLFVDEDSRPGAEPVAIIAHELWQRRYAGDEELVGSVLELDGEMRRIVGIMPPDFAAPDRATRVWKPYELDPANAQPGDFSNPGIARLAPGVTLESARQEVQAFLDRLPELFPDELPAAVAEQAEFGPRIDSLHEVVVGDVRQALLVVLGTVGFVLLIACANVANLFLVRAETRQREVTLRAALGAGRGDIARIFLSESMLLSLAGGVLGVVLALVSLRTFTATAPVAIPRLDAIGIDGSVLLFTAGVALLAGLLFGSVPILRSRAEDLASALREGGRTATSGHGSLQARNLLVVGQVALALVLLVGSGLMIRSFQALRNVDPGFEAEGVLTMRLALPGAEYSGDEERAIFWRDLRDRLAALPGVEVTGAVDHLPFGNSRSAGSLDIEDYPDDDGAMPPLASKRHVTPGFFESLRIPLLEGRLPRPGDAADGVRAAIVDAGFAHHWWPDDSALGKRIRENDGEEWFEIVGVVGPVHTSSLEEPPPETVYYPMQAGPAADPEVPGRMTFTLRTDGDPTALAGPLRDTVWTLDPRLPIGEVRPMSARLADSMARTSFTLVMLGIAAAVALLLGAIGIYGVISYVVARRVPEIGVRIALGAPLATVRRMVVRRGLLLTATGIGLGIVAALGLSRLLAALLYGVSAIDPVTYLAVAGVLGLIALVASWLPARRASRVDPVVALRAE